MAGSAGASCVAFYSCLLVLSLTSASTEHVRVNLGEDVLLPSHVPKEAVIRLLDWFRPDLKLVGHVFFYRNDRSYEKYQHPSFHGRVKLRDPEMKNGDVSVILKNVNINDTGTYQCRIIVTNPAGSETTSSELRHFVDLSVIDSGEAEHTWNEGQIDRHVDLGDRRDIYVGLAVGLPVAFVLLGLVACVILKHKNLKECWKQTFYQPPSEQGKDRNVSDLFAPQQTALT